MHFLSFFYKPETAVFSRPGILSRTTLHGRPYVKTIGWVPLGRKLTHPQISHPVNAPNGEINRD
jgi:hypothetical protein